MTRSPRLSRIEELLVRELSALIAGRLRDPRVGMATVMSARVTADLSAAKVYVSVLGPEHERDRTLAGLNSAAAFLRRELGAALTLKAVPSLRFLPDPAPDAVDRLERILGSLP
jgi:ribosome-binding factor A